jgi:hypothetical protein
MDKGCNIVGILYTKVYELKTSELGLQLILRKLYLHLKALTNDQPTFAPPPLYIYIYIYMRYNSLCLES